MANNDLDIVLRLVDQLTPMMARVQANLKTSLAAMGASTAPLNAALDQVAKGMNVAGQQASASGKMIAGMGQAGQEAAAKLQAMAGATANLHKETEGGLKSFIEGTGIVETFVSAFAVERLIEFAKGVVEGAARIEDLHLATGVSVKALQEFQFVGVEFGVDMEEMGKSVQTLSQRLATGDASAVKAIQMLGLNVKELMAAGPEEAFLRVAESVGKLEDPMLRGGVASELFGGKLAKGLLPMLTDLRSRMEEAGKSAAIMTDQTVKAAHDFDVGWSRALLSIKGVIAGTLQGAGELVAMLGRLPENLNLTQGVSAQAMAGLLANAQQLPAPTITSDQAYENRILALQQNALEKIAPAVQERIRNLKKWGESEQEIAQTLGVSLAAVHVYLKGQEDAAAASKKLAAEAAAAAKKWADAVREIASVENGQFEVLNRLGTEWTRYIAGLAKAGVSQAALALRFSLTDTEIKNIIQSVENYDKVLGLNNQTSVATEETLKKIGIAANDTDSRLIAMASTLDKIADIERGLALTNLGELPGFKVDPKDDLKGIEGAVKRADDAFRSMTDTLRSLGQTAGGTFGLILSGLGSMIELMHAAAKAAEVVRAKGAAATSEDLAIAAFTKKQAIYGGISIGASIAASAIDTSGRAGTGALVANGALQGAAAGAAIGTWAGPWGVAAGAGAGAIVGWVRAGKEWRQVVQDISRDFAGIQVSDDFAHMIADLEDQTGLGSAQAMVLTIDQLVQSVGGLTTQNLDLFTGRLRDAFSFFQRGEISAAQLTQVLDKNFQAFATAGTDSMGRLNDKVKELIRLQDAAGVQSKGIAEYLKGQGATALTGGGAVLGSYEQNFNAIHGVTTNLAAAQKAVDDLTAAGQTNTAEWAKANQELARAQESYNILIPDVEGYRQQLDNLGTVALGTFAAAVASGTGLGEAFAQLHPQLQALAQGYKDLGIPIEDAGLKALLLEDTIVGGNPKLIAGIDGLINSMVALENMSALTPKQFVAMQGAGVTMFQNLYNAALQAGGGAKEALIPMQGWLHAAMEEAVKLGLRLDDGTQSLIDQSQELGIWRDDLGKAKSPLDTLIDRIGDLIDTLMGIPKHITGPTIDIPPPVVPRPDFSNYPGYDPGNYYPTSFASEAFVRRPTLAMVGDVPGGEYILRPSTLTSWLSAAAGAGRSGAVAGSTTTSGPVSIEINAPIYLTSDDAKDPERVAAALKQILTYDTRGARTDLETIARRAVA